MISASIASAQDHGHLNAGAVGTKQSDKLVFDNAGDFLTNSAYVKTLTFTNGGTYAGYYQGNITLTALAATPPFGGPAPNAPALGSVIRAQLASVDGPPGGSFGFWDAGATNPTIGLMSGQTGTNMWRLTESDGSPGSDPYGHFHGRRFTATKPGLYTVSFRVFDTSSNGASGGPIHTPSEALPIYFQAGLTITSLMRTGNVATVTYGSITNQRFSLEYTADLLSPNSWTAVGAPVTGTDLLQSQQDTNITGVARFYRVKATVP
ncbi:MAG: hypothetical protein EXS30_02190 [Pedosphaera sp.]|nr:hypothetical protein [Pedosphaera sp.]